MPKMYVSISEEADKYLSIISADQYRSKNSIVKMAMAEFIEDWLDSKTADEVYEDWIVSGKKTYTLEEVCKENDIKLED